MLSAHFAGIHIKRSTIFYQIVSYFDVKPVWLMQHISEHEAFVRLIWKQPKKEKWNHVKIMPIHKSRVWKPHCLHSS